MCNNKEYQQLSFFDYNAVEMSKTLEVSKELDATVQLSEFIALRFQAYNIKDYVSDIQKFGLDKTWDLICRYICQYPANNGILEISNLPHLYEMGLAYSDKQQKKNYGQYYTPNDVAKLMGRWLLGLPGDNICDVGCGTGSLILAYLELLGTDVARKIIKEGKLFIYDLDPIALKICETSILVLYGQDLAPYVNVVHCDFLDKRIQLPDNCKVICNPPYAKIVELDYTWNVTNVIKDTKEYYAAFMEKIITQSKSAVLISPYSFISGKKFYSLRQLMNSKSGEIYSFDNVPGNIFIGKKQGVFNSNTSNSVRAAITVCRGNDAEKGFRLTPLIRFKQSERSTLLSTQVLESMLSNPRQIVSEDFSMYFKCDKSLCDIYLDWKKQSANKTIADYVVEHGKYSISMPNTCRYYTVASNKKMNRKGQIMLSFDNYDFFCFVFCLINSSFVYWYWRIFDGGITYPKNLLLQVPSVFHLLSDKDKAFFNETMNELVKLQDKYMVSKNNIGIQENIKYPNCYRNKINQRLLDILHRQEKAEIFDIVHSNMALEVNV